jgi:hypothetical protein
MRQSNAIRNHLDRILILLGKKVSQESAMQSMHATLLKDGFYFDFRVKIDAVCEELRVKHDDSVNIEIVDKISSKDISLGANQKLILRTIHSLNLKKAIVYSKTFGTTIWFPLDRNWQGHLKDLDLRLNRPMCTALLGIFKVLSIVKSFSKLARHEFEAIKFSSDKSIDHMLGKMEESHAYMSGFDETNFPDSKYPTYNFYDWFSRKHGTSKVYIHDCKELRLSSLESPQFYFQNTIVPKILKRNRIKSHLHLSLLQIRYLLNPKLKFYDFASQLDELILTLQLVKSPRTYNYEFVIFPSSILIAKPVWSVFLENHGSKVVLVNYTAMAEPLSPKLSKVVDGIWHLSSWKDIWVVDDYQATQMQVTSNRTAENYTIIGVPHWSGRMFNLTPNVGRQYLAVFDTHIRSNQVFSAGVVDEMGWNDPKLEELFISSVLQAASHLNLVVLHKKKRKVPQTQQSKVDEMTQKLKSIHGDNYQVIDEAFSAVSLINLSIAAVSKPISTTAFVATEMRKPSIILDPTFNVQIDDPGLRGCKLAYSSEQLLEILKSILESGQ